MQNYRCTPVGSGRPRLAAGGILQVSRYGADPTPVKRDHDGVPWRIQNPTPLMSGLADAFLPFFEWNEHLPDEDR